MTKILRAIALGSLVAGAAALGGCATCNDDPAPPPSTNGGPAATTGNAAAETVDPTELMHQVHSSKRVHLLLPRDADAAADASTGD